MNKRNCLTAVILLYSLSAVAQFPLPPERAGLAGQSLFVQSPGAQTFGNACTLDSISSFRAGIHATRSFLLEELNEYGAGMQLRLPSAAFLSAGIAVKGFSLFRYQELSFAFSKRFGRNFCAALGAAQASIRQGEGYGAITAWSLRSGLQVRLSNAVEVASNCRIPLRSGSVVSSKDFSIGLRYRFSQLFALQTEAELNSSTTSFLLAVRYRPHHRLNIDLGCGGYPFRLAFGCMMEVNRMRIRLSAMYNALPGWSPAIGVETSDHHD